jgi:hypothetical protein
MNRAVGRDMAGLAVCLYVHFGTRNELKALILYFSPPHRLDMLHALVFRRAERKGEAVLLTFGVQVRNTARVGGILVHRNNFSRCPGVEVFVLSRLHVTITGQNGFHFEYCIHGKFLSKSDEFRSSSNHHWFWPE